jgi:hypothetical protein
MPKIKDMSTEDLEHLIEQKLVEMLGDPDAGLPMRKEFEARLKERLGKSPVRIPHEEVLKRFA